MLDRLITHYRRLAVFSCVSVVAVVHGNVHKYPWCGPDLTFIHIYIRVKIVVFAYKTMFFVNCYPLFSLTTVYVHTQTRSEKEKKSFHLLFFLSSISAPLVPID